MVGKSFTSRIEVFTELSRMLLSGMVTGGVDDRLDPDIRAVVGAALGVLVDVAGEQPEFPDRIAPNRAHRLGHRGGDLARVEIDAKVLLAAQRGKT